MIPLPSHDEWGEASLLAAPWLTPEQVEAMWLDFVKHREKDDDE